MSYIILPSNRLRQPTGRVRLSARYAAIAEACIDLRSYPVEIALGKKVTVGSTVKFAQSFNGGLRAVGTSVSLESYASVPITAIGTADFTWIVLSLWHETWAQTTAEYQYAGDLGSSAAPAFEHPDYAGYQNWYNGSTSQDLAPTAGGRVEQSMHAFRRTGTTVDGWVNGVKGANVATSCGQNLSATTWNILGAKVYNTASLHPGARYAFAMLLRGSLPDVELAEIGRYPYGPLFVKDPIRIYFGAGAGGATDYPLTASPGSFSVTGQSATLLYNRALTASPGSLAITGQSATLLRNSSLTASPGSYTINGSAATLLHDVSLTASPGSYSLTGYPTTLDYVQPGAYSLTASPGSLSVAGSPATLTYTPLTHYSLTASPGSYAVAGFAATLTYAGLNAYTLTASPGVYAINGSAGTLTYTGASIWTDVGASATPWSDVVGATSVWSDL